MVQCKVDNTQTDFSKLQDNMLQVHSIESFGSVDGPGIRFVIFLKGCAMRCQYCHNPDTWNRAGGQLRSVDDVLAQAQRYQSYWGEKGGITVSGGEALLQIKPLTELFRKAKALGINTCLDTSAQPFSRESSNFAAFEELMKYTDLVLLDIKHIDSDAHKNLTGWRNDNILDCAHYLSDIKKPVWIRHVLVPGINDDDESLRKLRTFIDTLSNVEQVDVLPYHDLGVYKWEQLGIPYALTDVKPPSKESINHAKEILTE
ncbi:pyruvate formate lyase-activating protein [Prevotella scopos JCM 17725]|jgi:pyruvate formate-lyase 1-activating enzyme|nr:pyruvate formate-lyase-activating protein [Prevotella scopos]ANR73457.1 pyruvate formate-lyase 1-activating enzyme [Prevotella scopos JCM 17725]QUB44042.1 pyruvate formate lyase-activating protein [Prevotella scopos JCM 17725]